jgi:hypothetical protein
MRILSSLFFAAICTCAVLSLPVMAQESASAAAAQVTVTNVTIDPAVFFEDDTGIVTVEITNNGGESVAIRRATLYAGDVTVLSQPYDTTTVIGAGNRMKFSFTIKADVLPGIYYPFFSLDFRDAGYLRYPIQIRVDNQPLTVAITNKPDVFSEGRKDMVDVLIGNPRDNPVSGTIVHFLGEGLDPVPSSYFIGYLNSDQSMPVSVNITPKNPTTLEIVVDYKNGINDHSTSLTLPVTFGESKTEANPVLTNLVVDYEGGHYVLTGDVYNAGLEVANSVVLTTRGLAIPVDPYRNYVVGSLQPDDFSSFELTFTASNVTEIPIAIEYRDIDGNPFEKVSLVNIPPRSTTNQQSAGIALPIILIVVISALVIGGAIWYSWKKR